MPGHGGAARHGWALVHGAIEAAAGVAHQRSFCHRTATRDCDRAPDPSAPVPLATDRWPVAGDDDHPSSAWRLYYLSGTFDAIQQLSTPPAQVSDRVWAAPATGRSIPA